ncbi:hypothetical protein AVEN_243196-1 [Araneus ventricosus]|uniref:Uncharacterized protein n=1 Tax=Araneus ventricosus TaxID=182803 RepID=A0A4Y2F0T8_ARAVE|nr:hypothetical protein AVEN_243196-1 [Araneus ventricosus]
MPGPYCSQNSRIVSKVQMRSLETPPLPAGRSDYFRFPKLKEQLSGPRFSSDSDVKTAAENWLNGQGRDFYQAGLKKLVYVQTYA